MNTRKENSKKLNTKKQGQILQLYHALNDSDFTVAITGAGISLAAGGVTFRGMFSGGRRPGWTSGDPEKMYRSYYDTFLRPTFEHGPTVAHSALAKLEEMGKLQGIITTNGDCIHTVAGSKNVAEIQGSFQVNVCTGCGKWIYDYEIWNHGEMPTCPDCGSILVPFSTYSHIGLYEPDLTKAQQWMSKADLILIIGATGCYTSTYWDYQKPGVRIMQINPGRTYFDSVAELNIREGADPVFEELMKLEEQGEETE